MVCAVPCQLCQLARIEEDASAPNADIYLDVPVAAQRHEAIASWTWASVDVTRAGAVSPGMAIFANVSAKRGTQALSQPSQW